MILPFLIFFLMFCGAIAWVFGRIKPEISRWISAIAILINFLIVLFIWAGPSGFNIDEKWGMEYEHIWIPSFGITFYLALDGFNLLLLALTYFLGVIAVFVSWSQVNKRIGFFHFNILWIIAGITGVFLSLDLFLFYFFWEVMLIPMYFLISIWGYENKIYASFKFFLFTQASGLLMFLAILGVYYIHGTQTGNFTFNFEILKETVFSKSVSWLLMSGFILGFFVKLPSVPFHTWLPDAHTEAPTAGSVLLAGLMLKTGAYGLLRFVVPMFYEVVTEFAPYAMFIGMAGILYGAKLAFAQTDLKRMVAYTSVSHMGFVILGIFALNEIAYQGVILQIIAHGLSTGALFVLVGMLQERSHTRNISSFGGLLDSLPKMGSMMLIFAMASLGLPGLGNFVAEFLILIGSYKTNSVLTILASMGLITATVYSLRLFQGVFHGKANENMFFLKDMNIRELLMMISMVIVIVFIGINPKLIMRTSEKSVRNIMMVYGYYDPVKTVIVSRDSTIVFPPAPLMNYEPAKSQNP